MTMLQNTVNFLWGKITKNRTPEKCGFRHGPRVPVEMTREQVELMLVRFIQKECKCPYCDWTVPLYHRKGELSLSVDRIESGLSPYSLKNCQLAHNRCNESERHLRSKISKALMADQDSLSLFFDVHDTIPLKTKLFRNKILERVHLFDDESIKQNNRIYLASDRSVQKEMEKQNMSIVVTNVKITINGWQITGDPMVIRDILKVPVSVHEVPTKIAKKTPSTRGVVLMPVLNFLKSQSNNSTFSLKDVVEYVGDKTRRKQITTMFSKNGRVSDMVVRVATGLYKVK